MKSKYQVGDKVIIAIPEEYLNNGRYDYHISVPQPGLNERMVYHQGKTVTISKVMEYHRGGYKYKLEEGALGGQVWVEWMLKPATGDADLF